MGLTEAFLLDAVSFNLWIAARTDGISGSGTAQDPRNGTTKRETAVPLALSIENLADLREATATLVSGNHGFANGDLVEISGVEGSSQDRWNGTFGIYGVTNSTFKYYMKREVAHPAAGNPRAVRLIFLFDEVMRNAPASIRIHVGPGVFQTRGFAVGDDRGWQPKTGQKIVGAGFDVTTLQLVGADHADQHYHVIGMPITPNGSTPITPLQSFEVSDLTLDCNMDQQPNRPDPGYANVACGAVRIFGTQSRIRNVKAINWGTKSLQQGCFVFSIIQASAQPSHEFGYPLLTETAHNGIEDCIAVQPSQNNARETTVLHIGGIKNESNHAQGFGHAAFIRKNFVDCAFHASDGRAFPSAFITSRNGSGIETPLGTFAAKRPHLLTDSNVTKYFRFYSPKNPSSRWNGYFQLESVLASDTVRVILGTAPPGTTDDSSFVVMGTEFRGIAVSASISAVVEQNQIHNCWIGGPYQSPMDAEAGYDPEVPPTLAREERLDPLNALHTRSLIVRDNFYRNVAVGPYFNAGGKTHYSSTVAYDTNVNPFYGFPPPYYLFTPPNRLWVWPGAPILVEWQCDQYPNPPVILTLAHEVTAVDAPNSREFYLAVPPELTQRPGVTFTVSSANRNYWRIFGTDHLVIEGNQIWLADLDETEFALKEYPLPATPSAQKYRPYGIIVADNELAPGYAHRQVFIRNNKVSYVDTEIFPTPAGIGVQAGGGMLLAGIKQLHVTHNVVEVNARQPLRTFRCGTVRYFNNKKLGGTIVPGGIADGDGHYDEPETLMEDAFMLSLLLKRRRR